MFLAERYTELAAELADCVRQRAKRPQDLHSSDIRILLVTKYQSRADIFSALDFFSQAASLVRPNLGESYVQSAASRYRELEEYKKAAEYRPKIELIGPLQSNKVAKALQFCTVLHSVATLKLLRCLEAACSKLACSESSDFAGRLPIFFQYNAGGEAQKHGCCNYDELRGLTDALLESQNLCLQGIMCMSQAESSKAAKRRCFADARELASRLWRDYPPEQVGGEEYRQTGSGVLSPRFALSMGMSQDYREALLEGANVLRIGSLLFECEPND